MTVSLAERYTGCLVGLACGDALGGPVEFQSRAWIAARFPDGVREMIGGGWLHLAPGEITDDTQMALAIARACTPEDIDLDQVAASFVAWYRSGPKDVGTTTAAALAAIANGASWQDAGEAVYRANPSGAANGALMRCAPIALRFRTDPARLVQASLDTARITHAAPRSCWATVALNQALVHLLNGGDRADVLAAAGTGIQEPQTVAAIAGVPSLPREALESGGHVLDTLTAALWCLLNRDSAEEAIVAAVSLGDDADTTGAVTGALAGACWGITALPRRWRDVVQHREESILFADRLLRWNETRDV
jgi:ADP-ribosyl-[dinitrogen reductase] hydrolase